MATKANTTTETIDILEVSRGRLEFTVLGESPLICNAMSAKVKQELLFPRGRMTAAQKAVNQKHSPLDEFRDSIYRFIDDDAPTLLAVMATAFKKACMGAALDIPGAKKAQIGRLMYIVNDLVPIWGIPEVMMSVTRSADMNKTPDVRTRAIVPTWCSQFIVEFTEPMLKGPVISKLLGAAGQMQGVGDWRVEKGSGNYGRFQLVSPDDPRVQLLKEGAGREAQIEAMESPSTYDSETESLIDWYEGERHRRGFRKEDKSSLSH